MLYQEMNDLGDEAVDDGDLDHVPFFVVEEKQIPVDTGEDGPSCDEDEPHVAESVYGYWVPFSVSANRRAWVGDWDDPVEAQASANEARSKWHTGTALNSLLATGRVDWVSPGYAYYPSVKGTTPR